MTARFSDIQMRTTHIDRLVSVAAIMSALAACSGKSSVPPKDGMATASAVDSRAILKGPNVVRARPNPNFREVRRHYLKGYRDQNGACRFRHVDSLPPGDTAVVWKEMERDTVTCEFAFAVGQRIGSKKPTSGSSITGGYGSTTTVRSTSP